MRCSYVSRPSPCPPTILIGYRQGYKDAERRIVPPLKLVSGKLHAGPALHDGADDDLSLHAGKSGTQTKVGAETKRQMEGVFSGDIQPVWG